MLFLTIIVTLLDIATITLMNFTEPNVVLFTILTSDAEMPLLRELVGSIHVRDEKRRLILFSFDNSFIEQEVALWRGVEFVNINLHLFFSSFTTTDQSMILEAATKYLSQRQEQHRFIPLGKVLNYSSDTLTEVNPEKDQFSCLIDIKKELVFADPEVKTIPPTSKMKLALLVPTLNAEESDEPTIKQYLLKSLNESLDREDLNRFLISIYIGYDAGDELFDRNGNTAIRNLQREFPSFRFRLIRMYKTHWLTFICNRLFVTAYREGNDYFLQINDDVQFLSKGWLSPTVNLLENASVVGLNDSLWQCKLFTQALVDRSHYDQFGGFFFPPGIKDWYSDNWITQVYGPKRSRCSPQARIKNSNIKSRYKGCRKFRL